MCRLTESFYDTILNPILPPENKKQIYIEKVKNLYPLKYTDPDILQHIQLLKDREPEAEYTDICDFLEDHGPISYPSIPLTDRQDELYDELFASQEKEYKLTPTDIQISNILKARVVGLSITISPAENHFKNYNELLDKVKTLKKCKNIKSAQYYIEFHTNGSAFRPHIHMYAKLHSIRAEDLNRTGSYIRKKFQKIQCKIEKKHDITYGIQDYLSGKDSSKEKQLLKEKDKKFRKENKIPDVFIL